MESPQKIQINSFVYFRDNYGDMLIARVVARNIKQSLLTVVTGWYAEEPVVFLPLRSIAKREQKRLTIPNSIVDRCDLAEPV